MASWTIWQTSPNACGAKNGKLRCISSRAMPYRPPAKVCSPSKNLASSSHRVSSYGSLGESMSTQPLNHEGSVTKKMVASSACVCDGCWTTNRSEFWEYSSMKFLTIISGQDLSLRRPLTKFAIGLMRSSYKDSNVVVKVALRPSVPMFSNTAPIVGSAATSLPRRDAPAAPLPAMAPPVCPAAPPGRSTAVSCRLEFVERWLRCLDPSVSDAGCWALPPLDGPCGRVLCAGRLVAGWSKSW
mmetsp:Transcript_65796/g.129650  ORF Transcript_65796/g.129650 Transcript_65796/m.129650 type:complete len:242 (-) Transcript_65796:1205-1930(-)